MYGRCIVAAQAGSVRTDASVAEGDAGQLVGVTRANSPARTGTLRQMKYVFRRAATRGPGLWRNCVMRFRLAAHFHAAMTFLCPMPAFSAAQRKASAHSAARLR